MSVIDDVKQRLDVVQVVSEYVKLQKAGHNYKAACPFHSEKNPSFFVFPDKQSWHCFGACGTGGDIFSFIMKKEGVDFAQALRLLAGKAGVPLDTQVAPEKQAQNKEREKLYEINEAAAAYYHHILLNASEAAPARNYVAGRGLSLETIKNFQLGFAPEGWDTLKKYLKSKGYEEKQLLAAGLLVERDDKSSYDRFRNRLMFPIRNIQGKVTGFGGRALDDSLPKYLNSPQTLIYDKSSSLYGIDRAQTAIRQNDLVIITEGYMDVLTAHQYGYTNVVASMGTAMTDKQLTILKGLTRNLILALDADAAGEEAVSRSGEMVDQMMSVPLKDYLSQGYDPSSMMFVHAQDFEVKRLLLPQGNDLDDVIKENASQWPELIKNAKPMIDVIFEKVTRKLDLSSDRGKSLAVEKLLPLLSQMKDQIRQGVYVERLARLLKIDENVLNAALKRSKVIERKRKASKDLRGFTPVVPTLSSSNPLEQYCLALLFQYPELKSESTELSPDYFENTENRELFTKWYDCDDVSKLEDSLDNVLKEHLNNLLCRAFPSIITDNESVRRATMEDCVIRLQERRLRNLESKMQELLAIEAEIGGAAAGLAKLEEQGLEITKQLQDVFIRQNHRRRQVKSDVQ
jgi:DNA primase